MSWLWVWKGSPESTSRASQAGEVSRELGAAPSPPSILVELIQMNKGRALAPSLCVLRSWHPGVTTPNDPIVDVQTPQQFSCWGLRLGLFIAIHPSDVIFPYLITFFFFPPSCKIIFIQSRGKKKIKPEDFFSKKKKSNSNGSTKLIAKTRGTKGAIFLVLSQKIK